MKTRNVQNDESYMSNISDVGIFHFDPLILACIGGAPHVFFFSLHPTPFDPEI